MDDDERERDGFQAAGAVEGGAPVEMIIGWPSFGRGQGTSDHSVFTYDVRRGPSSSIGERETASIGSFQPRFEAPTACRRHSIRP